VDRSSTPDVASGGVEGDDVPGIGWRRATKVETLIGIVLIVIAAIEIVGIIRVVSANQPV
jgi:hypothetical protein